MSTPYIRLHGGCSVISGSFGRPLQNVKNRLSLHRSLSTFFPVKQKDVKINFDSGPDCCKSRKTAICSLATRARSITEECPASFACACG